MSTQGIYDYSMLMRARTGTRRVRTPIHVQTAPIHTSHGASPVTRLVHVGLAPPPLKIYITNIQPRHQVGSCGSWPPRELLPPHRDQTDRDLPRTNGVGVALAYGAYATVYRS